MSGRSCNDERVAGYATVPFQRRALDPILKGFPQSLVSFEAEEIKAWKPNAIVVTAEHEIPLFRSYCSANNVSLFALRHGAGNKYIAPCREYALADYICGSEWDQQDFRRGGVVPLREFLLTGNPWVDETFRLPPHALNHESPTVLFAPTWNPQTSAAALLADRLVPLVREVFPQARVVIRPHPNILTHDHPTMQAHAPLFRQWVETWRQAAKESPDVQFVDDLQLSISALFTDADILVSDGSSLIYEFAALERPILLYTSGEMPDFGEIDPLALANRYRDVGAEFRTEQEFVQALGSIFAKHREKHQPRQKQLADELFGKYRDGRSTERVIAVIREVLHAEKRSIPQPTSTLPAPAEQLRQRADEEFAAGRLEEAGKLLVEALTHAPHQVNTIVALANLQIERHNRLGALTELTLALALDPGCIAALSSLAALHIEHNCLDEAKPVLERLLSVQPDNAEVKAALATIEQTQTSSHTPIPAELPELDDRHERIACPFCGSREAEAYRVSADIVRCRQCQTVYLRTRLNAAELDRIYQTYVDDGSHLKLPVDAAQAAASPWKRDSFLREILQLDSTRGGLLDVGCSWGAFLLGAREQGFRPMGIEITRKAVRFANETLQIPVANTQFLNTAIPSAALQVVTMLHVLEHLPQPKQAIAKAFDILSPGGLFCGIVPNIDSFSSQRQRDNWYWLDPNYHYVHYSPSTLRAHLKAAGFVVERLYTTRGDFDAARIRALVPQLDDTAFADFLREIEAQGQGEEIRFFARKPSAVATVVPDSFTLPCQTFNWPAALDPYVCKSDGKYLYLSPAILEKPEVLAQIEPFYFHCGGAGDALLLLSSFYDAQPNSVVLSYPNSIPAARSLFDAFPHLGKIYFLPQHANFELHARLRSGLPQFPNFRGMGTTPRGDYGKDWTECTNIFRDFGVAARPAWVRQFRVDFGSKRVIVAPRGSLVGMAGSKRNIIEPRDWPELLRFLREQDCLPVIIGTPDERAEYPSLDGCEDQRSYSFAEQMKQIASSELFVGADSWGKTFAGLTGIQTIVFDAIKSLDWNGQKDPSDYIFLDPWDCIQVVSGLEHCKDVLTRDQKKVPQEAIAGRHTVHVAWEGSFADSGSLSHVNRELTRQLARQKKVDVVRVGDGHRSQAPTRTQVTVRHAWPPNWEKPKFGKWVVIQPWEFGSLPQDWVEQLKKVDEVWAPSEYVRRVYLDSGVQPSKVKLLPNGIDPQRFHPGVAPINLLTKKSFKFLFVGGTIGRKGPDVLLDAYLRTFTAADDVCLVIKDFAAGGVYTGQTFGDQIKVAQTRPGGPEILYINEDWPAEKLPSLYTACDCLVHPFRGEGFALPVLEAMACGLPVIVTAGGATDDFASDEHAYRIPANRKSIGYHAGPFRLVRPGWLLEPCLEELCTRLRWVIANREEARAKGRSASEYVRHEWTWERASQIATGRLQELVAHGEQAPMIRRTTKFAEIPPLPEVPRLSVCVIAKNEEHTLARCLQSLRGIADQVVVVDTGSTDHTIEVAKANGAEVYSFAWNDDFSAARNIALEQATGDWVLTLDSDEELAVTSHEELRKAIHNKAVLAYRLPIADVGHESEGCYYVPRLFRNAPSVRYEGRIHEQVRGIAVKDWALGKVKILHHGYTPQQQQNKNARNLRLLELALRDGPEDPNLLMNLGLELARAGRLESGIEQYRLALQKLSSLPQSEVVPELRETLLIQLGAHLSGIKKFHDVVRLYSSPFAQQSGLTASMHFSLGIAHMQLSQFAEAAEEFRCCLAKRGKPSLCPVNKDVLGAGPRHCLAVCFCKLKRTDDAEREFRSALDEDPKSRPLRFEYAMFRAMQQAPVEALKILHELVTEKADEVFVWLAGGQVALGHPDFLEFACDWTGEALKMFPQDPQVRQQRAEVSLLNGDVHEALELYAASTGARNVAARLICQAVAGREMEFTGAAENAVDREFLDWYQRLVRWGASGLIMKLNENVHVLRNTLPTAAAALEAAFSEAQQPAAV